MDNDYDQEQLYRVQLMQAFDIERWYMKGANNNADELSANNNADELSANNNGALPTGVEGVEPLAEPLAEPLSDAKINATISDVYLSLCQTAECKQIIAKARLNTSLIDLLTTIGFIEADDDIIFRLLFKYEYFDAIHRCIVDFARNGNIHSTYLNNLLILL